MIVAASIVVKLANGLAINSIGISIIKTNSRSTLVVETKFQKNEWKGGCILEILILVQYNPCIY